MKKNHQATKLADTLRHWRSGVRLYVAIAVVAVTLEVWWWAYANYSGSTLFATRMEEVYAWLALGMVTLAISIGPFFKLFPDAVGKRQWFEARRLIGVGGAWFASLHVLLAYDSLFNFANPLSLPKPYQQSFLFGAVALAILLVMAGTSFDAAFTKLGKWWFRLHRLVYVAMIAILVHIFIIGVHATQSSVLTMLAVIAAVVLAMHIVQQKTRPKRLRLLGLALMSVALVMVFSYGYHHQRNGDTGDGSYAQTS